GVVVATPASASTTCSGGTITAVPGSGVISYSGGSVSAGANCTVQANVTGSSVGSHVNITGDLTSSSGNSGTAQATLLTVPLPSPSFSKAFAPETIGEKEVSTLTFTIDNSVSSLDATSLNFTDTLPMGVVVAIPANTSNSCSGGTLTAVAEKGIITYTGGTVGASSSCIISVDVTSSYAGIYLNTTGDLSSSAGNSGTASDTLTVKFPWVLFVPRIPICPDQPDFCYLVNDGDNEGGGNSALLRYYFKDDELVLLNRLGVDNVEASALFP
ncbi:MAG: hypothetical protein GY703_26155, partial [Gammaproteobacteria bacterium]|nr:hypothetical protein [Gammaproteobacteria bacterium]